MECHDRRLGTFLNQLDVTEACSTQKTAIEQLFTIEWMVA